MLTTMASSKPTFLPEGVKRAAARTTLLVLADQKQRKHLNYAGLGDKPGLGQAGKMQRGCLGVDAFVVAPQVPPLTVR